MPAPKMQPRGRCRAPLGTHHLPITVSRAARSCWPHPAHVCGIHPTKKRKNTESNRTTAEQPKPRPHQGPNAPIHKGGAFEWRTQDLATRPGARLARLCGHGAAKNSRRQLHIAGATGGSNARCNTSQLLCIGHVSCRLAGWGGWGSGGKEPTPWPLGRSRRRTISRHQGVPRDRAMRERTRQDQASERGGHRSGWATR